MGTRAAPLRFVGSQWRSLFGRAGADSGARARRSSWSAKRLSLPALALPLLFASAAAAQDDAVFSYPSFASSPVVYKETTQATGSRSPLPKLTPPSTLGGATLRQRRARVNFEQLAAAKTASERGPEHRATLAVNLFGDAAFTVVGVRSAPTSSGYSLSGQLDGLPWSTATLVVNGEVVVGTVRTPAATYIIESAGDGLCDIREVDPSDLPPLAEPLPAPEPPPNPRTGSSTRRTLGPLNPLRPVAASNEDEPTFIDVLVLYTPAVRQAAGGRAEVEATVDLWFAETNQAYEDSGANLRIFLTRASEVDYEETGNGRTDLHRLYHASDGHMDGVHELRERTGADLVHLVVEISNYGGIAGLNGDFGLTRYASGGDTMAHELGHNMGLTHDRYAAPGIPQDRYGNGYVNQAAFESGAGESRRWRTIMAYSTQCNHRSFACPSLLRFSNPEQTLGGDALGVPADSDATGPAGPADARRALNENRASVAARRKAGPDLTAQPSLTERSLQVGESFTMRAGIINQGRIESAATTASYHLSLDAIIGQDDTELGRFDVAALAAKEESADAIELTAPSAAGNHYYGACVAGVDAETDTGNNCSHGIRATVGPIVSVADASAPEGFPVEFPVMLSEARASAVDVRWALAAGTAAAGVDLPSVLEGTLTIPANAIRSTIAVDTVADSAAENDDTFTVTLVGASPGPPTGAVLSVDGSAASGTILDDDGDPDFVDAVLRSSVLFALGKESDESISAAEMATLTRMSAPGRGIADLRGLESATGMRQISFSDNAITDLTPLGHLVGLRHLSLDDNRVTDLAPLSHLPTGRTLRISRNRIADVSPLSAWRYLTHLGLNDNAIEDLSPLAALTRLTNLELSRNRIVDISPLRATTNLAGLHLNSNKIRDLSPLARLEHLTELDLGNNRIVDIGPLTDLYNLKRLRLDHNSIADVASVAQMDKLRFLHVAANRVSDLSSLADHPSLSLLDLRDNSIRDLTPLATLTRLTFLDLANNSVTDIAPLVSNNSLSTIHLHGNPLSEESIATHLPALQDRGATVYYIGVSVSATSAEEGQPLEFPVGVSQPVAESVSVWYRVSPLSAQEGDDYPAGQSDALTIPAGATRATIFVDTNADDLPEPHEALSVQMLSTTFRLPTGVAVVRGDAVGVIVDAGGPVRHVPLFFPASHHIREGFVRIVNRGQIDAMHIDVVDDAGGRHATTLALDAGKTVHLNSTDLEEGNPAKGLTRGVGRGQGDWRMELRGDAVEVFSYMRTRDGFLTSLHDLVPASEDGHEVPIFNPGRNVDQVSLLRLVNAGGTTAEVTIAGIDDDGVSSAGTVRLSVPGGRSRTISAQDLESGAGLDGALGEGTGKWRLLVTSDKPVRVLSLMESPTGRLTNLSTAPANPVDGVHAVPLFPAASDPHGRHGFVRVINRSNTIAAVDVAAFDETDREYESLTLTVPANKTVHFDSNDLELGNEENGLSGTTGAGEGAWRLELTSEESIEVLSYIRTTDGFLTSMHDVVPAVENRHRVAIFNPGRIIDQVSRLRLINAGEQASVVTIRGIDDAGGSSGAVRTSVPAGTVKSFTAVELESGTMDLEGMLGTGAGKWQLIVESDQPISVMNLLESSTGHLTNLSTVPPTTPRGVNSITINDEEIYKDGEFANFGNTVNPDLPTAWVASGANARFDGIRIYADGSVRPDIDPGSVVVDSSVRYVFTFKWESQVLNVVRTGDIVDVRFTPSNAAAVAAFYDLLVNDTVGSVTLSDDTDINPTPNP